MLPNNPNHDTDTRPMAFRSASRGTGKEQYPSQLEELVISLLLLSLEGRLLYDDNTRRKVIPTYDCEASHRLLHNLSAATASGEGSCEKAGRRQMIRLHFFLFLFNELCGVVCAACGIFRICTEYVCMYVHVARP